MATEKNKPNPTNFLPSKEIFPLAKKIAKKERVLLENLVGKIAKSIEQVGSSALPGAVGKMDVDFAVRVDRKDFEKAIENLSSIYTPWKKDTLWNKDMAVFSSIKECPIDVMVVVIDTPYDYFHTVRDYLRDNPAILKEYNALKKQHQGSSYKDYRSAKNTFFRKIWKDVTFLS